MFFLRNNSLLTWLGNNYTNPLQEAGVFTTLCMIHSRGDFCLNFCCYGVPHALIVISFPFYFWGIMASSRKVPNLFGREEEEEQEGEEASEKK